MNEKEIIENIRISAKADHEYFSNENKPARERWVVSLFLSLIKIEYQDQELVSPEQSSKADVLFRDARFQVKELTDPEMLRSKMYKNVYGSVRYAKTLEKISLVSGLCNVPPVSRMYELILELLDELELKKKYQETKGELDLLIYVTQTRAALIQPDEASRNELSRFGWRSVICVNEKQAVVLHASSAAPEFIGNVSRIVMSSS